MIKRMSIHQALSEVKFYGDRISRAADAVFIASYKKSTGKVANMPIKDAEDSMRGSLQSVKALIANDKIIKAAIAMSNATTRIKIGDDDYTVVEAIERKGLLRLEEKLLLSLQSQYTYSRDAMNRNNDSMEDKLQTHLKNTIGEATKDKAELIRAISEDYKKANEFDLFDPCDIAKEIKALEESITAFKTEVDYKLSESNATTFIEVDLVD